MLVLVGAARQVDHLIAFNAAGTRVDRVGANACQIVHVKGNDVALVGAGEFDFNFVFARMDIG